MNIFTTRAKKVLLLTIIFTMVFTTLAYGSNENSNENIEVLIEKVCLERGVPAVLIKAIATLESGMQQFNSNGTPKTSRYGNVGVMQVGNYNNMFDVEKLKYDIEYNINAGIDVLLIKWNSSVTNRSVSNVGNMDPNVLENWYFALWAYNGWVSKNNPNYNYNAYQNRIYRICSEVYEQPINYIDFSSLPSSGQPSRGLTVKTPDKVNYAKSSQMKVNDLVVVNTIIDDKYLRDTPNGTYNFKVSNGQTAKVTEGPVLTNGYYWYKVLINDKTTGWIERNWIKKIGDSENGIYPFEDIIYHWTAGSVMNLYNSGYITGKSDGKFYPDNKMTREDFCTLLARVLQLGDNDYTVNDLRFNDKDKISSYAVKCIASLDNENILRLYSENFEPNKSITRGEIIYMIANCITNIEKTKYNLESSALGVEREFNIVERLGLDDIELTYNDIDNLADWQKNNIKILSSLDIMNGVSDTKCEYGSYINRGTTTVAIDRFLCYLNK